jgi:hypothetical protein
MFADVGNDPQGACKLTGPLIIARVTSDQNR